MPCALTEPDNYPDYLKSILKEIQIGNNDDLKACACQLKSPTTEDGCLIVDENNKVGAFPFCSTLVTDGVGDNTEYPLKLTLKQAMDLYWQTTSWKFSASAQSASRCGNGGGSSWNINYTENKRITSSVSDVGPPPPNKNLVCFNFFQYTTNYNGSACSIECIPIMGENYIVSSIFETFSIQIKYKKEGNTYYFYPYFHLAAIGTYGTCAGSTETIAGTYCDGSDWGSPTNYTVSVKILGKTTSAPLRIYQKLFNPTQDCSYTGSSNISTLEFT
jgi:hypothetical protein